MVNAFSDDEIRKILLEHRYLYPAAEVCAKWGITRYRLRRWQKQFRYEYLSGGVRELVILGLYQGIHDLGALSRFIDYHDHAVYSAKELRAILKQIQAEGFALCKNNRWLYNPKHLRLSDRSFIF